MSTTRIPTSTLSLHDALPICKHLTASRPFFMLGSLPHRPHRILESRRTASRSHGLRRPDRLELQPRGVRGHAPDRKSTRLNSSHLVISYAVFCLKKKKISSMY